MYSAHLCSHGPDCEKNTWLLLSAIIMSDEGVYTRYVNS